MSLRAWPTGLVGCVALLRTSLVRDSCANLRFACGFAACLSVDSCDLLHYVLNDSSVPPRIPTPFSTPSIAGSQDLKANRSPVALQNYKPGAIVILS